LLGVFDAFRGCAETLSRDNLEFICLELATGEIPTTGTSIWLADRDPGDIIEILWHVGFLTAQSAGNGRAFVGAHQIEHPNLAAVRRFQVHPMFTAYLGITRQ
jgi:hypothetical protein